MVREAKPIARAVDRAGILDAEIRAIRNSLDKFMFHILASGSTLLTIAFSSHSFTSLGRKFSRVSVSTEGRTQFRNAL